MQSFFIGHNPRALRVLSVDLFAMLRPGSDRFELFVYSNASFRDSRRHGVTKDGAQEHGSSAFEREIGLLQRTEKQGVVHSDCFGCPFGCVPEKSPSMTQSISLSHLL